MQIVRRKIKPVSWTRESKIWEQVNERAIQCKCSNKIPIGAFHERGVAECNWCHRLVFRDPNKQKQHDIQEEQYIKEKQKKNNFEMMLKKYMKESNENVDRVERRNLGVQQTTKNRKKTR